MQLLIGQPCEVPTFPAYVAFSTAAAGPCAGDYVLTDESRTALVAGGAPNWALAILASVRVTLDPDALKFAFGRETPVRAYPVGPHNYVNERMDMTFACESVEPATDTATQLVFSQAGIEARYRRDDAASIKRPVLE